MTTTVFDGGGGFPWYVDFDIPTTGSGTAYAAGDALGTAAVKLSGIVRSRGGGFEIRDISGTDLDKQMGTISLLFFTAAPTAAITDNGAYDMSDADKANFAGFLTITAGDVGTGDYAGLNDNAVFRRDVALEMKAMKGQDIWVLAISKDTKTYASANAIHVRLFLRRDE